MLAYQLGFMDGHRGQYSMQGWWTGEEGAQYEAGVAAGKAHALLQQQNERNLYVK